MPQQTIVFDLNETLLDLSALDPLFADAFGDKGVRRSWFAQTLQNTMAATILGSYEDFTIIAQAALEMTARKRGVTLDDERMRRIMRGLAALPAHGDVLAGLGKLRAGGFRCAVLTNSPLALARPQLERAHIDEFFEAVLTVESVRCFKPAPQVYAMAAERLDTAPSDILFVSVHDWDLAGAARAGFDTAFLSRHGTSLNPLEKRPAIEAPDIVGIADAVARRTTAA